MKSKKAAKKAAPKKAAKKAAPKKAAKRAKPGAGSGVIKAKGIPPSSSTAQPKSK
jgi:hypothetical protein